MRTINTNNDDSLKFIYYQTQRLKHQQYCLLSLLYTINNTRKEIKQVGYRLCRPTCTQAYADISMSLR